MLARQPQTRMAARNLEYIVTEWREAALAENDEAVPNPLAMSGLASRLSVSRHSQEIHSRHRFVQFAPFELRAGVVVFFVYAVLMSLACKGRPRRRAFVVAILLAVGVGLTDCAEPIANLIWRGDGDQTYLSEYTYLPVADWRSAGRELSLVAYQTDPGWPWHAAAFNDGSVRVILNTELEEWLARGRNASNSSSP